MNNVPPQPNEAEVTLLGTGGGYGESVILKIGVEDWIIIDSCVDPYTKGALPLQYLHDIGVSLDQVKLVVCTHWHNDHILGISKILELCVNAKFVFSRIIDLKKFLFLCNLDSKKASKGGVTSTEEFIKCIEIVKSRGGNYFTAEADKKIFRSIDKVNNLEFELYALSPSPKVIENFTGEISSLITEFGESNSAIVYKSPNEKSVALLLKFGDNRVILGADLEIGRNDEEGWKHIIVNSLVCDEHRSSIFKIPHHGSENGYHKDVFVKLINDDVILKIAPFARYNLPSDDMISIYFNHSSQLYLTSNNLVSKKPKNRDKRIAKIAEMTCKSLKEVKFNYGIIQSRINYANDPANWVTQIDGTAFQCAL